MPRLDFVLWVMTFWPSTNALSCQLKLTIVCSWMTVGRMSGTACTLQLPSSAKLASSFPHFPSQKKSHPATSLSHYLLSGWKLVVFFTLTFRADLVVDCTGEYICMFTCQWLPYCATVYTFRHIPDATDLTESFLKSKTVSRSRVKIGKLFQNLFSKL